MPCGSKRGPMRKPATAHADPFGLAGHRGEQVPRTLAFILFLDGTAVEQGLAQNPAVVCVDQVFFDQQLIVSVH